MRATLDQSVKLLELFREISSEKLQGLFESGLLTDLRDADISNVDRGEFRKMLSARVQTKPIVVASDVIDCEADPFKPSGWQVKEEDQLPYRVRGQFIFDPAKVKLYLARDQRNGIEGNKLCKKLASQPVLGANVLDYLLDHPHLIPEEWKRDANGNVRFAFFWGTIYCGSSGRLYVRYLCFNGGRCGWSGHHLGLDLYGGSPAAVRAN